VSRPGARQVRLIGALAAVAAIVVLAGCGGGDDPGRRAAAASPGMGGTLTWALGERPAELDPLLANSRSSQLVTRQIHEPLVEALAGPFEDLRRQGLASFWHPSEGRTIWSFRLRSGVRFQDGTRFNASAVLANAQRWRTTPAGQALVPGLFAADAPRPDLVRFILDHPDPNFPKRLADPRTGIVSPRALDPSSGQDAELRRELRSGTGPFELRESDSDGVVLARNPGWWGTRRDLGPALDQVEFRVVRKAKDRLALLSGGDVQVAEPFGPSRATEARSDPLLEVLGGGAAAMGLQRSVRGITSAQQIPSLSAVWLTRVGTG
jgi:peptide/nickel transport system substrate-binding protein